MNIKNNALGGFSLIELMVGMTIGLITVLVVTQVMSVAETKRQASTSGADSVVNVGLGLYTIERDGKNAGYGLMALQTSIGCPIKAKHGTTPINFNLVPVTITDGASGAPNGPDQVRFLASSKSGVALPMRISQDHPVTAANFFVDSDMGAADQDLMLAVPATLSGSTWCTVFEHHSGGGVGGAGGGGGSNSNGGGQGLNQILHPPGQSPLNANTDWPSAGYTVGDAIINLGNLSDRTYFIDPDDKRTLQVSIYTLRTASSAIADLYPNIVQLQAVYGKDTDADEVVDAWNNTTPATSAEWRQIRAIRVALVARGQTRESGTVTLDGAAAASTCASTDPHPAAVCWKPNPTGNGVKIDVSTGNAEWQRYRYRVVETTIPLRNVIWRE